MTTEVWRLARVAAALALMAHLAPAAAATSDPPQQHAAAGSKLDHTGRARVGKASYYARSLHGRRMADGSRANLNGDAAASKTLPLGTRAKVTNLKTGKSAVVTIRDRGPYVKGRIVDLTPATAQQIGIDRQSGVAPVRVAPIQVPQPDGSVKAGDAAREAPTR